MFNEKLIGVYSRLIVCNSVNHMNHWKEELYVCDTNHAKAGLC